MRDQPSRENDAAAVIERYEAIIHDWTCGCGKGKACPNRDGCREAAEQIAAGAVPSPPSGPVPLTEGGRRA